MYYRASLSVVSLRQFLKELSFFVNLEYLFEMLSWNFAHDFVLMYYRSSSSVVTLQPSVSLSVLIFTVMTKLMCFTVRCTFNHTGHCILQRSTLFTKTQRWRHNTSRLWYNLFRTFASGRSSPWREYAISVGTFTTSESRLTAAMTILIAVPVDRSVLVASTWWTLLIVIPRTGPWQK